MQEQIDVLKVLLLATSEAEFARLSKFNQATLADDWTSSAASRLFDDPFPLAVAPSRACSDGGASETLGVFARGPIPKGRLVCVYPGLVSLPSQFSARAASGAQVQLSHCAVLFDGTVIDPTGFDASSAPSFAVGHMCNHPPKGMLPNVIRSPFFWSQALSPNVINQRDPSPHRLGDDFVDSRAQRVRGLGFVSLRDVAEGEEIFVNYRLNPSLKSQWPSWYHPVDQEEDDMRWAE